MKKCKYKVEPREPTYFVEKEVEALEVGRSWGRSPLHYCLKAQKVFGATTKSSNN